MDSHDEASRARLGRLRMRSWRRGTREMDLILGAFADRHLGSLADDELEVYEALLSENDHDLYQWVAGGRPAPARFAALLARIAAAGPAAAP